MTSMMNEMIEPMVGNILALDESVLSVSVVNMKGRLVEYKSKYQVPSMYT